MEIRESGKWILNDPQFRSWLRHGTDPVFWLVGQMGVGKTILISTIIQALTDNDNLRKESLLAYFYLDGKSQHLSDTSTMLRSLLRQLGGAFKICFESLESLWSKTPKPLLDNNRVLDEIRKVICSTPTIMLIDGLDEAKQGYHAAEALINLAYSVPRQNTSYLRLLVSGREPQIVPRGLIYAETLSLESVNARKSITWDICQYVDLRVPATLAGQSFYIQEKVKDWLKTEANTV